MSQDKHLIISRDGYPMQIESVQTLNDAAQQALTSVAAVCGSNTILKGCENVQREGNMYVNDGIVCIDGKIYQFKGGLKTGGVTIITDKVDDIYDTGDGSAKQMLPVRAFTYATGSAIGSVNIPWTSFVSISDLKGLTALIPKIETVYDNRVIDSGTIRFRIQMADSSLPTWSMWSINLKENINNSDYVVMITHNSDTTRGGVINDFIDCKVYDKLENTFVIIAYPNAKTIQNTDGYSNWHQIDWCVIKKSK